VKSTVTRYLNPVLIQVSTFWFGFKKCFDAELWGEMFALCLLDSIYVLALTGVVYGLGLLVVPVRMYFALALLVSLHFTYRRLGKA